MRKTDCLGETRLVPHVPSSYELESDFCSYYYCFCCCYYYYYYYHYYYTADTDVVDAGHGSGFEPGAHLPVPPVQLCLVPALQVRLAFLPDMRSASA